MRYRVLVVDDETIMRKGIVNYIERNEPGLEVVGEAVSGEEAIELFSDQHPDIVLSDICMKGMDGIELTSLIKKEVPETKVVLISGHNDFEFAQRAVRLGVDDYLLKPFAPTKLGELLSKLTLELDKRKVFQNNIAHLNEQVKGSLPIVREHFLTELVGGKLTADQIRSRMDFLQMDLTSRYYSVSVLRFKRVADQENNMKKELIKYFVTQIIEENLRSGLGCHDFFVTDNRIGLIITADDDDRHKVFNKINMFLMRLVESMKNHFDEDLTVFNGRIYEEIQMISVSYGEAIEALTLSFGRYNIGVINVDEVLMDKPSEHVRPAAILDELMISIKIGEKKEAIKAAEKAMDSYRLQDMQDSEAIKADITELVLQIQRHIEKIGGRFSDLMISSPYSAISEAVNLDELRQLTCEVVEKAAEEVNNLKVDRSNRLIDDLRKIAEANIANEEFSLDDAAERLFISTNYLRQLFKKQTGETFLKYMTGMRMERAKALLEDKSLTISEVSADTGYPDQRYFSKCFKKYFDMTPTEYRERN